MTENKLAERTERVSYTLAEAAELLGISYTSLWREVKRRKIYRMRTLKRIARAELLRYAAEETQLSKRTKRFPATARAATRNQNTTTQETHVEPISTDPLLLHHAE